MAPKRASGPKVLGRYELLAELSQSYLGPLWAVRVASGEGAGITAVMRRITADNQALIDRLSEAAWTAMEIQHDWIPKVVDVIVHENEIGVVSDYAEALALRNVCRQATIWRKPTPPGVALRIGSDVLEALKELHGQAAEFGELEAEVYGGITPDSVLLGTDGHARLIDILVAGAASTIPSLRDDPERVAYAAPEQLTEDAQPDARTDLFCLGILLWEMLSNRRLFVGFGESAAQKVLAQKIPRLDEIKRAGDPEIPGPLVDLMARVLDRDPAGRPQSAEEMLQAVQEAGVEIAEPAEATAFLEEVGERDIARQRNELAIKKGEAPKRRLSAHFRSLRAGPPSSRQAASAPAEQSPPAAPVTAKPVRQHKQTLLGVPPPTAEEAPPQQAQMAAAAQPAATAPQAAPKSPAAQPPPAPSRKKAAKQAKTMLGLAPGKADSAVQPAAAVQPEVQRWTAPQPSAEPAAAATAGDQASVAELEPEDLTTEPPPFKRKKKARRFAKQTLLGVAPPAAGSQKPARPTEAAAAPPSEMSDRPSTTPAAQAVDQGWGSDRPPAAAVEEMDEGPTTVLGAGEMAWMAADTQASGAEADEAPAAAQATGGGQPAGTAQGATANIAAAIASATAAAPSVAEAAQAASAESVDDKVEGVKMPPPMLHDAGVDKTAAPTQQQSSRFGLGFLAGVGTTLGSVAIGALVVFVGGKLSSDSPDDAASATAPESASSNPPAAPAPSANKPSHAQKKPEAISDKAQPDAGAAQDAGKPEAEEAAQPTPAPEPVSAPAPVPRPRPRPRPKPRAYVPDDI